MDNKIKVKFEGNCEDCAWGPTGYCLFEEQYWTGEYLIIRPRKGSHPDCFKKEKVGTKSSPVSGSPQ